MSRPRARSRFSFSTSGRSTPSSSPAACASRRSTRRSTPTIYRWRSIRELAPTRHHPVGRAVVVVRRGRAAHLHGAVRARACPILGICYGVQLTALLLGGEVVAAARREYGRATVQGRQPAPVTCSTASQPGEEIPVWMSHGDRVRRCRLDSRWSARAPTARRRRWRRRGGSSGACSSTPRWPTRRAAARSWRTSCSASAAASRPGPWPASRRKRWPRWRAGWGRPGMPSVRLSGGVDSSVAAALVLRAIGTRLTCIFVDTGLQRSAEAAQVESLFRDAFKADLRVVDASERFLGKLAGVTDPEQKRKIIGARVHRRVRGRGQEGRATRSSWCRGRSIRT